MLFSVMKPKAPSGLAIKDKNATDVDGWMSG